VVHTARAEEEHRCSQEDRPSDHAARRCSQADEHDASGQREGSHGSMQPTAQPRLDRFQHRFGDRCLCVWFRAGLREILLAQVDGGHGSPSAATAEAFLP
jgi:hypothetical protein